MQKVSQKLAGSLITSDYLCFFQGRAIRHQGDYATILLLDRRYSRASTVAKLPGWISKHLQKMDKFGPVFAAISKVVIYRKMQRKGPLCCMWSTKAMISQNISLVEGQVAEWSALLSFRS